MAGLAHDVQPVIGQGPMSADDQREDHATIAAINPRPMPNPHYDRVPAGYQPLEPREETSRLLDRD